VEANEATALKRIYDGLASARESELVFIAGREEPISSSDVMLLCAVSAAIGRFEGAFPEVVSA